MRREASISFLEMSVAQRVGCIPADANQDHVDRKAHPFEVEHVDSSWIRHCSLPDQPPVSANAIEPLKAQHYTFAIFFLHGVPSATAITTAAWTGGLGGAAARPTRSRGKRFARNACSNANHADAMADMNIVSLQHARQAAKWRTRAGLRTGRYRRPDRLRNERHSQDAQGQSVTRNLQSIQGCSFIPNLDTAPSRFQICSRNYAAPREFEHVGAK